ncbi:hypothetical protein BJ742DRAFT_859507 [Cladochytrium replicatum]|nr:hypothetical protein BJ742DRAFT_859507 [Cladochytrium replicatum]
MHFVWPKPATLFPPATAPIPVPAQNQSNDPHQNGHHNGLTTATDGSLPSPLALGTSWDTEELKITTSLAVQLANDVLEYFHLYHTSTKKSDVEEIHATLKAAETHNASCLAASLPHELLLRIFEPLWYHTPALTNCTRVCKAWNVVAREVLFRLVELPSPDKLLRFVRSVTISAAYTTVQQGRSLPHQIVAFARGEKTATEIWRARDLESALAIIWHFTAPEKESNHDGTVDVDSSANPSDPKLALDNFAMSMVGGMDNEHVQDLKYLYPPLPDIYTFWSYYVTETPPGLSVRFPFPAGIAAAAPGAAVAPHHHIPSFLSPTETDSPQFPDPPLNSYTAAVEALAQIRARLRDLWRQAGADLNQSPSASSSSVPGPTSPETRDLLESLDGISLPARRSSADSVNGSSSSHHASSSLDLPTTQTNGLLFDSLNSTGFQYDQLSQLESLLESTDVVMSPRGPLLIAPLHGLNGKSSFQMNEDRQRQKDEYWNLQLERRRSVSVGVGKMVKKLVIPSNGKGLASLVICDYVLPSVQCLHLRHPLPCEHSGITFDSRLFFPLTPFMRPLLSLIIEDIDSPCWSALCGYLITHGRYLINLNLEAKSEIDTFESTVDMGPVFQQLTNLQFLRLDGIPVGHNDTLLSLIRSRSSNLRAVTLDYCLDISMDALCILCNACPNLDFLGLAGIVGPLGTLQLVPHYRLRTLRVVDCDVSDELFVMVAKYARCMEMLRIVFEDDSCEGIRLVASMLSDVTLDAFAGITYSGSTAGVSPSRGGESDGGMLGADNMPFAGTLKVLALTRCERMSGEALARCIAYNKNMRVLDLHKHPDCEIGFVDDGIIRQLMPVLLGNGREEGIRMECLNLYGQNRLSESLIIELLMRGGLRHLRGLCLNSLNVGKRLLDCLLGLEDGEEFRDLRGAFSPSSGSDVCSAASKDTVKPSGGTQMLPCPHLIRLSLVEATSVTKELLRDFLERACGLDGSWEESFVTDDSKASSAPTDDGNQAGSVETSVFVDTESTMPVDRPVESAQGSGSLEQKKAQRRGVLRQLQRVYTGFQDLRESRRVNLEDRWFVDEGLDILSLWSNAVERLAGRGRVVA